MNELTSDFLKSELGGSFYKELYQIPDSNNTVVLHEKSGRLFVCKRLKYYDIRVYEYLSKNFSEYIPRINEYYNDGDDLIVYEEFVEGKSLDKCFHLYNDKELLKFVDEVCEALIFLHKSDPSIIHRDIKMSNIMITPSNHVKLIDFNAAKVVNPNSDKDTVLLGTEGYAAPEQYGFGSSDIRTDVYGVGKLIKELFGSKKYYGVVNKATHIDPDKRYSTIKSLKFALHYMGGMTLRIPGFRNPDLFFRLRSAVGYFFAIWLISGMTVKDYSEKAELLVKISFFLWFVLMVDMFSGISPIFTKMPLTKSSSLYKRIIGYVIYFMVSFVVALILPEFIAYTFNF